MPETVDTPTSMLDAVIAILLVAGAVVAWLVYRATIQTRDQRAAGQDLLWVCDGCRSANELHHQRCYRCGAVQTDAARARLVAGTDLLSSSVVGGVASASGSQPRPAASSIRDTLRRWYVAMVPQRPSAGPSFRIVASSSPTRSASPVVIPADAVPVMAAPSDSSDSSDSPAPSAPSAPLEPGPDRPAILAPRRIVTSDPAPAVATPATPSRGFTAPAPRSTAAIKPRRAPRTTAAGAGVQPAASSTSQTADARAIPTMTANMTTGPRSPRSTK